MCRTNDRQGPAIHQGHGLLLVGRNQHPQARQAAGSPRLVSQPVELPTLPISTLETIPASQLPNLHGVTWSGVPGSYY